MDSKTAILLLMFMFVQKSFPVIRDGKILLFEETGLTVKRPQHVQTVQGQHTDSPAFKFGVLVDNLRVNEYTANYMANEINEENPFTISSWVKLDVGKTDCTLVSVNGKDGDDIYFKLSVMERNKRMRVTFTYLSTSGEVQSNSLIFRVGDLSKWQKIAVKVHRKDKEISFYHDDEKMDGKKLKSDLHVIPTSNIELRLAQEYKKDSRTDAKIGHVFIGSLQDTMIEFDQKASSSKPDKCVCEDGKGGPLKSGCVMDGIKYYENTTWTKDECNFCKCEKGQITCIHHCPVCQVDGKMYVHGDKWDNKKVKCTQCSCIAGVIKCGLPVVCPKPNCAGKSGDVITLPGQCCPICKEDQCIGTGKEYKQCECPRTCFNQGKRSCSKENCVEGCFCPKHRNPKLQLVQNPNGVCVRLIDCPCEWKGEIYLPRHRWQSNDTCTTCYCLRGEMGCSNTCE